MLASNLTFTSDFYFNTLNSPSYANLTNDLTTWLNNAFSSIAIKSYSVNFVAYVVFCFIYKNFLKFFFSPSPIGTYISISMAVAPTTTLFTPVILSDLATALAQNSVTPLGRQLSINPLYISNPVTEDVSPPYTCKYKIIEEFY